MPLGLALESARHEDSREPIHEEWYHGPLSRADAEKLLLFDGDFLVRAAGGQAGQFVLSGRHNGRIKHLLLVDPDGLVSMGVYQKVALANITRSCF